MATEEIVINSMVTRLSVGTIKRIERIMELRGYTTIEQALDYCVNVAWLVTEKRYGKDK